MAYGYKLITDPKILPKLVEVLDLILKKRTGSKIIRDGYFYNQTNCHTKHAMRKKSAFNECLLNHRFDDALKLLWITIQERDCFSLVLYKGIMVALENLLSDNGQEIVKKFSSDIKGLPAANKLEIQLEYLIYCLKNDIDDEMEDPKKKRIKKIPHIDQLYTAYHALKAYLTWLQITQSSSPSKDESKIAYNIITSFKNLIDNPGIWDIFVLKLIEVLEYYTKYEDIEEILKKYVERNPNHVNAYIYICVHLHKRGDSKLFNHYAEILFHLCPSDERVLLLVQKWNEEGKYLKKRLKILFMFLDYPVNGNNLLGWQQLSSHLAQAVSSNKSSTMNSVKSAWSLRCHSWKYMHFSSTNVHSQNFDLTSFKIKVLSILDPDHDYIISMPDKFPHLKEDLLIQSNVTQPISEDFSSLYHFEDMHSRECF